MTDVQQTPQSTKENGLPSSMDPVGSESTETMASEEKAVEYDKNSNITTTSESTKPMDSMQDNNAHTGHQADSDSNLAASSNTKLKEAKLSPRSEIGKVVTIYGNKSAKVNLVAPLPVEEKRKKSNNGIGKLKHNFGKDLLIETKVCDHHAIRIPMGNSSSIFQCESCECVTGPVGDNSSIEMFCLDCHEVQKNSEGHEGHQLVEVCVSLFCYVEVFIYY